MINIFDELKAQTTDNILARTEQLYDDIQAKFQEEINNENKDNIDSLLSLQIVEINPTNGNTLKSYQLQSSDGNKKGVVIDIPKDQTIKDVKISTLDATLNQDGTIKDGSGTTALCISYILSDGTFKLVTIDYQKFLEETEFQDGFEIKDHKVYLKIDESSKDYLILSSNGIKISQATETAAGVMSSLDKAFINGIRGGNKSLPNPVITGSWTFYNNDGSTVNLGDIYPVPNTSNPTLEQGFKASFSGTYKWVHDNSKKDPTQVQSGSSWGDLPESNVNSQVYTSPQFTKTSSVTIGIQAAKTGLMVSGNNVVPASGMDTATDRRTVTFNTMRYWGLTTDTAIESNSISSLNKELGGKSATKSGITASTTEYFVYAYPKSLGTLQSIVQNGSFDVFGAFQQSELIITNQAGLDVELYVYKSLNRGAFNNATLQFS